MPGRGRVLLLCALLRATAAAASPWQIADVDAPPYFDTSSIALGANGTLAVAYGYDRLYYAVADAGTWRREVVDQDICPADLGLVPALAFDAQLHPGIAYVAAGSELRVARHDGSAWTIETVPGAGMVEPGFGLGLAFDAASHPTVAYLVSGARDLAVARHDGTSWSVATIDSGGDVGAYARVAIDPAGQVWISYHDFTNQDLRLAHWDGTQWLLQTVDAAGSVGKYTSIALDSAGRPWIGYVTNTTVKVAHWDGSAWQFDTLAGGSGATSIAIAAGDVPWLCYSGGLELRVAWRGPSAWTPEVVVPTYHPIKAMALDDTGQPAVSYYDQTTGALRVARRGGGAWPAETIDAGLFVALDMSLAFDPAGYPALAYGDNDRRDLHFARWDGSAWSWTVIDSTGDVGNWASLAYDASGRPAISYHAFTGYDLRLARFDGTAWNVETVDSAFVGSHTSLRFDGNDRPVISYRDGSTSGTALKLARWNGSSWQKELVDTGIDTGYYTELALDAAGKPSIAYLDWSAGAVRLARWDGTMWQKQTVATGLFPSLALDAAGDPLVSYISADAVMLARWNGSAWTTELVAAGAGREQRLRLDRAGKPVIAYSAASGGLWIARFDGSAWQSELVDPANVNYSSRSVSLELDAGGRPAIGFLDRCRGDLRLARSAEPCTLAASAAPSGGALLCIGESMTLAATVTGCSATPALQWRHDGVDVPGATGLTYDVPGTIPAETHRFDVRVDCPDAPGCSLTTDAVIVEVSSATAVVEPGPIGLCAGAVLEVDGSASAVANCPDGPQYQWVLDGSDAAGETADRFAGAPALAVGDHALALRVTCATNPACTETSPPIVLAVARVHAPVLTPAAVSACAGDTVSFDASAASAENCPAGLAFQWTRDGSDVAGATSATYDTPPLAAGIYAHAVRVACAAVPSCAETSLPVPVSVTSATGPGVTANSLAAVRGPAGTALSWGSPGSGTWNVHRTELAAELFQMWTRPVLATIATPAFVDPDPVPASGAPWHYQAFGAGCGGSSVP